MPGKRKCEPGCECGAHSRARMSDEELRARARERNRRYRASLSPEQKEAQRVSAREYRARNPEKWREYNRKDYQRNRDKRLESSRRTQERYRDNYRPRRAATAAVRHLRQAHGGMRPEDWAEMFAVQAGRCCYCERPLPEDRKQVHIDHDHSCTCGPLHTCWACRRGLACHACNQLIGLAGDDPRRLELIAANLRRLKADAQERINTKPAQGELPIDIRRAARRQEESA